MINTIFYYPESMTFEEYQSKVGTDIAARTIVFADAQKAIYKGGKQFGSTSLSDLKTQIEQIFNENPYTLPIATASRLGGIMIGKGFSIDPKSGKLDVDFSSISGQDGTSGQDGHNGMDGLIKTIFDSVTNIRASKNDYGIVKIGKGIDVTNGVISVDFSGISSGADGHNGLDGLVKTIFDSVTNIRASKNDYGIVKVGDGINVDNGVISVSVSDVANAVVPNISAAATVSNTTGTPTVTVVKTGTDAAPTFTFNFAGIKGERGDTGATGPQGPAGGDGTGSNYDDKELRNLINLLDKAIDALNATADSESDKLDGVINGLDGEIQDKIEDLFDDATWIQNNWPAGLTGSSSNFGLADVEAYLQLIGVWTTDGNGNTITQWSKIAQDVNSLTTTVAGLQVQAGDTSAITALQSSLEQYVNTQIGTATNNLSTTYARKSAEDVLEWMYSSLKQQSSADKTFNELVSAGKSGLSSAISEVRTYVEKLKNGEYVATASLEAKVDEAIAGLKVSASSNNAKTEIFNKIDKNSSDIAGIVTACTGDSSSASILTKFANWKSGLITTSTLDGAIATLLATNGTTTSGIMTEAEFNTAKAELVAKNEYTAASIVAKVNDQNSSVTINADKINITGQNTFISNLISNSAFIAALQAIDVAASSSVVTGDSGEFGTIITGGGIIGGINQGNITTSTNGDLLITEPSFRVWAASTGSQMKVSNLTTDTLITGGHIAFGPHLQGSSANWLGTVASFRDNAISFLDGNDNLLYNMSLNTDRSSASMIMNSRSNNLGHITMHPYEMTIFNHYDPSSSTARITISPTGIEISGSSVTRIYITDGTRSTSISPGQIILYDGTTSKTITATS